MLAMTSRLGGAVHVLERLVVDGEKRHAVTGFGEEGRIAVELIGSDRRAAEQVPAARRGQALDAGLDAADRDRAGRRQQPRRLPPRHVQGFVEAAEIGPARREADHGDLVVAARMPGDDVVGRGVEGLGDILEIDAVLAAIGHGNAPAPRLRGRRQRPAGDRQDLLAERVEADLAGIVVHQQRTIGRHGLGDTVDRAGGERLVERQHALVGIVVDGAAELDRDGTVATGQKTGRGKRRGHELSKRCRNRASRESGLDFEFRLSLLRVNAPASPIN